MRRGWWLCLVAWLWWRPGWDRMPTMPAWPPPDQSVLSRGPGSLATPLRPAASWFWTRLTANPRVILLPPHDLINLAALCHPDGHTDAIDATQPTVEDPAGRYTTRWGVGWTCDTTAAASGVPGHVITMREGKVELRCR